jgi:hypothetical protein
MDFAPVIRDLFPEVEPHMGNADENQRFTIRRARDWCKYMACVAGWTLDAAACREAHHAPTWYGLDHPLPANRNGLIAPWFGDVFNNPPWDDISPWVVKAWRAWTAPAVAQRAQLGLPALTSISMLLPGNRTHRDWWVELVEPVRDGRLSKSLDVLLGEQPTARLSVHFAPERFPYGAPGNPEGIGTAEPNFTSVLLVWNGIGGPAPAHAPPKKKRKLLIKDVPEEGP